MINKYISRVKIKKTLDEPLIEPQIIISETFVNQKMADLNQNTNTDFNQILLMIQEAKARVYAKANAESILLNVTTQVGKKS